MAVRTARPLPPCGVKRSVEYRGPKSRVSAAVRSVLPSSATSTR